MKSTETKKRKDESIFFRLSKDEKTRLQDLATKKGMTLTELLLSVGQKGPVRDYRYEKELFQLLTALTTQMNSIGKDIKLVASQLSKKMVNGGVGPEPIGEFNLLFNRYLESRDALSIKLENLLGR